MHSLRHFYYQNKEKIWKVVLIIAFLLGAIYYINYLIQNKKESNNVETKEPTTFYANEQDNTYISDTSAISGGKVSKEEAENISNSISKFLQYCKNGNVEQAYNMLSNDCKETEYETIEDFQKRYLNGKFNKNDTYEIEKWIWNTYKVSISEDILATGNIDGEKRIEYITIVKENSQDKLNINGYIGKHNINKTTTSNDVKITVLNKKVYMDYEEYDFSIENLSNKTIKLDSLEKTGTMYLESSSGSKYNAYGHELTDDDLEIKSGHTYNLSIKYANEYSDKVTIKRVVFSNVILDYPKYKLSEDTKEFKDVCELNINM